MPGRERLAHPGRPVYEAAPVAEGRAAGDSAAMTSPNGVPPARARNGADDGAVRTQRVATRTSRRHPRHLADVRGHAARKRRPPKLEHWPGRCRRGESRRRGLGPSTQHSIALEVTLRLRVARRPRRTPRTPPRRICSPALRRTRGGAHHLAPRPGTVGRADCSWGKTVRRMIVHEP
jgi:hypothetical protein